MRKIRNYTTESKLVTKQITYFCGVIDIQSEITTEQFGEMGRNGSG